MEKKYYSNKCKGNIKYKPENGDTICLETCRSEFYKWEGDVKKCESISNAKNCYYKINDNNENKQCFDLCAKSDYKYYNVGNKVYMHTCNTGSSSLFKYHKKGEFEYNESCDLILG